METPSLPTPYKIMVHLKQSPQSHNKETLGTGNQQRKSKAAASFVLDDNRANSGRSSEKNVNTRYSCECLQQQNPSSILDGTEADTLPHGRKALSISLLMQRHRDHHELRAPIDHQPFPGNQYEAELRCDAHKKNAQR